MTFGKADGRKTNKFDGPRTRFTKPEVRFRTSFSSVAGYFGHLVTIFRFYLCISRPSSVQKPARELKVEDALLYLDQVTAVAKCICLIAGQIFTLEEILPCIPFFYPLIMPLVDFAGQNGVL